jgi:hypothetical protein
MRDIAWEYHGEVVKVDDAFGRLNALGRNGWGVVGLWPHKAREAHAFLKLVLRQPSQTALASNDDEIACIN